MTAQRTLRATIATAVASALLAGCSSVMPDQTPTQEPSASTDGTGQHGSGTQKRSNLPATVSADDDLTLTGCTNSVGWIENTEDGLGRLGAVATTSPGTVLRWRPSGPEGDNTREQYRLLLSADGTTAAVTSVETVRVSATIPDRLRSVVQIFDLTTRTQTAQVNIPGAVFPSGDCYDTHLVLSPDDPLPLAAKNHKAHIIDVATGKVTRSITLASHDDEADHVAAVVAGHLIINRYNRATDSFATEGVSMRTGKRTWMHPAIEDEHVALTIVAADPRFPYVIGQTEQRTLVLRANSGKIVAGVPAPERGRDLTTTATIDPFTGIAYITDGNGVAQVALTTGKASALPWARRLQRVNFDMIAVLDSHMVAYAKDDLHSLKVTSGADEGVMKDLVAAGGLNWSGVLDDETLSEINVYEGEMSPRVFIDAEYDLVD